MYVCSMECKKMHGLNNIRFKSHCRICLVLLISYKTSRVILFYFSLFRRDANQPISAEGDVTYVSYTPTIFFFSIYVGAPPPPRPFGCVPRASVATSLCWESFYFLPLHFHTPLIPWVRLLMVNSSKDSNHRRLATRGDILHTVELIVHFRTAHPVVFLWN